MPPGGYREHQSSAYPHCHGERRGRGTQAGIHPSFDLEAITTVGNVTSNTLQFNNATTGFVTTANIEVGTANLFVEYVSGDSGGSVSTIGGTSTGY